MAYNGCTQNLKERMHSHTNGYVPATSSRLPVEIIFYCAFKDKYKAFAFKKFEIRFRQGDYEEKVNGIKYNFNRYVLTQVAMRLSSILRTPSK